MSRSFPMMRGCREIAELRSRACDERLPLLTRFEMWLHGRVCDCKVCSGFGNHMSDLRDATREAFDVGDESDSIAGDETVMMSAGEDTLTDEAKVRMQDLLREAALAQSEK